MKLSLDFSNPCPRIKPLHGVNNAPLRLSGAAGQDEFRAAGIPFVRMHDTGGAFGGSHYIDIPNIFPDFDADENDPASYDFAFTDAYLKPLVEAGCRIFYRLGVTIENNWKVKAYNIFPPKDYAKWARVCEHVVRHYNEGWAGGFRWGIEYWEIWNEPENPPMWQGTKDQFFELYRVVSNHLKAAFPSIKVGGYAGCGFYVIDDQRLRAENAFYRSFVEWFEDFCRYVQAPETKSPLDFFSWHLYVYNGTKLERIATHADYVRRTLDAAGLATTESVFDEWNVFRGEWERKFSVCKTHVGAANVAAAFCLMQETPIDKAMYYDAQPMQSHCGLFTFPDPRTTPCFEAFRAWNALYRLGEGAGTEVEGGAGPMTLDGDPAVATTTGRTLYAAAAKHGDARAFLVANVGTEQADVDVAGAEGRTFALHCVDAAHGHLTGIGDWAGRSASRRTALSWHFPERPSTGW